MKSGDKDEEQLVELATGGREAQDGAQNREDVRREQELADRERNLERVKYEREIEFSNREKELMQRELELARREIDILRRSNHVSGSALGHESRTHETREDVAATEATAAVAPLPVTNMNLKTIAKLVSEFGGTSNMYDVWERQVKFMKATYQLADDAAKTLIEMKLKKKAFEWLHSRAEHLTMTFDELMDEVGRMYRPKQSKINLFKKFETRAWKRDKTLREYAHDKIIMGHRVSMRMT